jgi:hypothetical protein
LTLPAGNYLIVFTNELLRNATTTANVLSCCLSVPNGYLTCGDVSFPPPGTLARARFAIQWSATFGGAVALKAVCRGNNLLDSAGTATHNSLTATKVGTIHNQ